MEKYIHTIERHQVEKIRGWIRNRQGIAIWKSVNLSNPSGSWTSPATIRKGDCTGQTGDEIIPYPKPNWQCDTQPAHVITSEEDVLVSDDVEVKRFRVSLTRSGLTVKLTPNSTKRVRKEVAKAGKGSFYRFDYDVQECVIFKQIGVIPLSQIP